MVRKSQRTTKSSLHEMGGLGWGCEPESERWAKNRAQVRISYLMSSNYGQGGEIYVQRRALNSGNADCAIFGRRKDVPSLSSAQAIE